MRKQIVRTTLCAVASLLALTTFATASRPNPPRRVNIVLIMCDDLGYGDVQCLNPENGKIKTPHVDRLASQGMTFTDAHSGSAVCTPTRYGLLTGRYSWRTRLQNGVVSGFNPCLIAPNRLTVAGLLKKQGYATGIIGKWHLKSEPTGFDHYNVMPGHGRFYDCWFKEKGKTWRDGVAGGEVIEGYLTDVITDLSIDWLKNRKSDKPFCLMVHHKAPHSPHHPDSTHANMYEDVVLPEPATLYDDWATRSEAENMTEFSKIADCNYPEYKDLVESIPDLGERTRIMYQEYMKGYIRLVASLDENIEYRVFLLTCVSEAISSTVVFLYPNL